MNDLNTGTPYYVYMLRCRGGSIYTGITTNPERRLEEHSGKGGKGAKYTQTHEPICFEAMWAATDRASASRLEYNIKKLSRAEKERLISKEATPSELIEKLSDTYIRIPV